MSKVKNKPSRDLFICLRSSAETDSAHVFLKDIYLDGEEYPIGSYDDKTAFIIYKAIKTVMKQTEKWDEHNIEEEEKEQ